MLIVSFHQVYLCNEVLSWILFFAINSGCSCYKEAYWKYVETDSFLLILISTQSLIKFDDRPLWMTGLHFLFSYT